MFIRYNNSINSCLFNQIYTVKMKKYTLILLAALLLVQLSSMAQTGRQQWTEEEAWEWHDRVGVIKGFNQPMEAYPGMPRKQILKKAAELGFNSVRFWIGGSTADDHVKSIRKMAEEADAFGLKISPVLAFQYKYFPREDKEQAIIEAKKYVQQIIGAFANDSRIVLWDIWNEPLFDGSPEFYEQMDWLEQAVYWCREMSPIQPITASIFWDTHVDEHKTDKVIERRSQVEALMDIHNFHHYQCAEDHMRGLEKMVKRLQKISNRPMVCTEAIARTTGATVPRSLVGFAEHNIHFFTWGLYVCDKNWTVTWGRSTYEPFEPMFHELLHPDGEPYDWRDIDWIRNFHFAEKREKVDPGAEITERWTKDRAWRWMVTGPIKGINAKDNNSSVKIPSPEYNGLRVNCSYEEWKADSESFFKKMDDLLSKAEKKGIRVLPVLLTDQNVNEKDTDLASYVAQIIRHYATDPRIQAWEIYTYPGEIEQDTDKISKLLQLLFRYARFEFPNQPLTATPLVKVKDFTPDFKYKEALIHGKIAGWNMLLCEGGSTPELCNLIWSLSDIVSFASSQNAAETGWLTSIAYRYGRPLICTEWVVPNQEEAKSTLEIFSKSHVFWYASENSLGKEDLKSFNFKPISTPIK